MPKPAPDYPGILDAARDIAARPSEPKSKPMASHRVHLRFTAPQSISFVQARAIDDEVDGFISLGQRDHDLPTFEAISQGWYHDGPMEAIADIVNRIQSITGQEITLISVRAEEN